MSRVMMFVPRAAGFLMLAVLLALRVAVAAILGVITPIAMPVLALLTGGALLIAMGFAWAGHWHEAAKGLWACVLCGGAFVGIAVLAQIVNPLAFSQSVSIQDR